MTISSLMFLVSCSYGGELYDKTHNSEKHPPEKTMRSESAMQDGFFLDVSNWHVDTLEQVTLIHYNADPKIFQVTATDQAYPINSLALGRQKLYTIKAGTAGRDQTTYLLKGGKFSGNYLRVMELGAFKLLHVFSKSFEMEMGKRASGGSGLNMYSLYPYMTDRDAFCTTEGVQCFALGFLPTHLQLKNRR